MADLLSSVSPISLPATLLAPGAPPGTPGLAAFVELMAGQAAAMPASVAPPATADGERQDDAAGGKPLPDDPECLGDDPALAWLLAGPMPVAVANVAPPIVAPSTTAAANPLAPASVPDASGSVPIDPVDPTVRNATVPPIESDAAGPPIAAPLPARKAPAVDARPDMSRPDAAVGASLSSALIQRASGDTLRPVVDAGTSLRSAPSQRSERPSLRLAPGARGAPLDPIASALAQRGAPSPPVTPAIIASPAISVGSAVIDRPADRSITINPDGATTLHPGPATAVPRAPLASEGPATLPQGAPPLPTDQSLTSNQPRTAQGPTTAQPIASHRIATPAAAPAAALPALFALAAPADRARDRDDRAPAALSLDTAPLGITATPAITPTADTQRQTLDLGRQDWPQRMVEHIETLRDDADARDTSIRLRPEALGRVDVALRRHDDGAVSVRFTAETPATRTLIADAAPQLRDAAEARGIRLTQTSVDLSQHDGGQRARPNAAPTFATTNHLAETTGDHTDAVDDGRIA